MTWKKREERLRRFQRYIQEKKHRAKYEIKRKRLYSCADSIAERCLGV